MQSCSPPAPHSLQGLRARAAAAGSTTSGPGATEDGPDSCVSALGPSTAPDVEAVQWYTQCSDGHLRPFARRDAEDMERCFVRESQASLQLADGSTVNFNRMTIHLDGTTLDIFRKGLSRPQDGASVPWFTPDAQQPQHSVSPPTATDAEQAVRSDDLAALQRYVEHGGDPNATVLPSGCTLLYIACRGGRLTAARYLVEVARADVNLASGQVQSTPLHGACYGGHPDVVEMLVRNGADKAKKNRHGHTPHDDANQHASNDACGERRKSAQACVTALDAGVPSVAAVNSGATEHAPHSAELHAREADPFGWRANISSNPTAVDLRLGYAQYLIDVAQEMAAATAQLQIAAALDPTRDDAREVLAMTLKEGGQHAAALCVLHTVAVLVQAPPPPHTDDATALLVRDTLMLHFAAARLTSPHDAFAALDQYLAAYAGDPNAPVPTEDGHSLLYLAACSGHVALVLRLVNEPRTIVSKRSGPSRSTALHGACANGHEDTVRLLLSYGADTGACNKDKATPRQLAHAKQQKRCVALLDAMTNGTLPLGAAVPVVFGSPKSAPKPMPAVAKRVDTFAQLRGIAAGTNPPPVFTRRIEHRELTVQYLCTACRDKKTGKPTKCPTFADFYRHVTGTKCVATGLQGSYRLLHMDTTQPKAAGGGGSAAAAPTATPLKAFTNDRGHNVVVLYNAMCAVLDNDTLCRSHGNTVVSCLLDRTG